MKRGKRQVIEAQPQQEGISSQEHLEQPSINYFTQLSSTPTTVNIQQKPHIQSQEMTVTPLQQIQPIMQQQKETIPETQQQKVDEAEEKRKKIELLKQKYLKKNKVDDVKVNEQNINNNSVIIGSPQAPQQQQNITFSEDKKSTENIIVSNDHSYFGGEQEKVKSPSIVTSPKIQEKPVILNTRSETVNNNLYEQYQQQQQNHEQSSMLLNKKSEQYKNEPYEVTIQEPTVDHHLLHHEVPKPPTKHHFKNPPPPPHTKKIPQPVNNQPLLTENNDKKQEIIEPTPIINEPPIQPITQKPLTKPIQPPSPPVLLTKPEILSTNSSKSEKQDNKSFAPPSTTTSTDKFEIVEENRVPPPSNRNMKDLLNKKLSSNKNIPRPPQRNVQSQQQQQQQQQESSMNGEENGGYGQEEEPYGNSWGNNEISSPQNHNNNNHQYQAKHKNVEIDDEYTNLPPQSTLQYQQKPSSKIHPPSSFHHHTVSSPVKQPINPEKYISEWLSSPEMTLKELHPEMKEVIEYYCLNKHLKFNILSNNSSFSPLVKQIIESFLLNNAISYTEEQKAVAESVCLTYFYTNAAEFNDIFLIILIKLGQQYLVKYQQALDDQFFKYMQRILMYKNVLLPEEINQFVKFCIDYNMINEDNVLLFLMLASENANSQFLQYISQLEITQLINNISILSFCQLNLKNKNVLPLYIKTISNMEQQWIRYKMVEKILNHLKNVDIPENLYQYTKQLKLKLLKNYENNGIGGNEQPRYYNEMPNQPMTTQSETNKDTGLFGLFNINKAIDKIKTQTEKALGAAVEKQKKPLEEEKKDEIIYDPIRKRYIINGEIPEDENEPSKEESTEQKVKAPPPPPMAGRKPPPPMPGKKTGARITSNRYA